jgi:hypothetical protein
LKREQNEKPSAVVVSAVLTWEHRRNGKVIASNRQKPNKAERIKRMVGALIAKLRASGK